MADAQRKATLAKRQSLAPGKVTHSNFKPKKYTREDTNMDTGTGMNDISYNGQKQYEETKEEAVGLVEKSGDGEEG